MLGLCADVAVDDDDDGDTLCAFVDPCETESWIGDGDGDFAIFGSSWTGCSTLGIRLHFKKK